MVLPKHDTVIEEQYGYCNERTIRALLGMPFPDLAAEVNQQILTEQVRLPYRSRLLILLGKVLPSFLRKILFD